MTCLLHRWRMNRSLDDSSRLPASTADHLGRCAECRSYQADLRLVGPALDDAAPVMSATSLRLANQLAAIPARMRSAESASPSSGSSRRTAWRTPAWGVAALAAVGGAWFFTRAALPPIPGWSTADLPTIRSDAASCSLDRHLEALMTMTRDSLRHVSSDLELRRGK